VPCCKWRMFFMFHTSKLSIYPDILTDLLFGFIWIYLAIFGTFSNILSDVYSDIL
jgi:hypothetical protein